MKGWLCRALVLIACAWVCACAGGFTISVAAEERLTGELRAAPDRIRALEGEEVPVVHQLVRRGGGTGGPHASGMETAFERLTSLVGTWREVPEPRRRVRYRLTGGGAALMEEFLGSPAMTSVYHLDGQDLMLTHYCNAGNQPRMRAASWEPEKGILRFEFMDVTNLSAPGAYFTRDLEVRFLSEDRIILNFIGEKSGREIPSPLELVRVDARSQLGRPGADAGGSK